MTRKAISIYMAATCAIVIVAPGRFVCGIVIAVELICLMLFGLLLKSLLKKMNLEKTEQAIMLCFVIFFTVFYKQILIQIMPQLSFVIFLPSISTFTTVFLLEENDMTLKESLLKNMPVALGFASYLLVVSLLRDIAGFGTITLPALGEHFETVIFSTEKISFLTFFATIPGSLVLTALLLSLYLCIEKKLQIVKKAGN